jgi:hypothetical protein
MIEAELLESTVSEYKAVVEACTTEGNLDTNFLVES